MFKSLLCHHQYEMVQEYVSESKAQHRINLTGSIPSERDRIDFELFYTRKHITTFCCKRCGKIKRYLETL